MKKLMVVVVTIMMIVFPAAVFAEDEVIPSTEDPQIENSAEKAATNTVNEKPADPAVYLDEESSETVPEVFEEPEESSEEEVQETESETEHSEKSSKSFQDKYPETRNILKAGYSKGYVDISILGISVTDEDVLADIAMDYGPDFKMIEKNGVVVAIRFLKDGDADEDEEAIRKDPGNKGPNDKVSSLSSDKPQIEIVSAADEKNDFVLHKENNKTEPVKDNDPEDGSEEPLSSFFAIIYVGLAGLKKLISVLA